MLSISARSPVGLAKTWAASKLVMDKTMDEERIFEDWSRVRENQRGKGVR
jgi:hypothetical protein